MITIQDLHKIYLDSDGISTDTRNIKDNSLFFALKGANFDGNLFAQQALAAGARIAIVDNPTCVTNENIILVNDVLKSLQELANYHRNYLHLPILGITGTNGKTTTKELINCVLKVKFRTYATQGNLNNHIGVPLTLLAMDNKTEFGIVEMGANHPGEIEFLSKIADPDFGLITNVGKAHLEGFGSFEGVKKTKAELYRHLEEKDGVVFINEDNEHLLSMRKTGGKNVGYGKSGEFSVIGGDIIEGDFLQFNCTIEGINRVVKTKLIGAYNQENVLAALCVGTYFHVDLDGMLSAIENYIPSNNRSELVITSRNKILFDAYNANPTSMKAALNNFVSMKGDNKFVIVGEMKELGEESGQEHLNVVRFVNQHFGNNAIYVGRNYIEHMSNEIRGIHFNTVDDLVEYLDRVSLKNYFILVKGSRSNQLEKLKVLL